MRFVLFAAFVQFKLLWRGGLLFAMLVIAAIGGAASLAFSERGVSPLLAVRIGLFYGQATPESADFAESLTNASAFRSVSFVMYESEEALRNDVAARRLECGYILSPNFDGKIKAVDLNGIATVVKSPATVADAITNELVVAEFFRLSVLYSAEDIIETRLKPQDDGYKNYLAEKIAGYESLKFVAPQEIAGEAALDAPLPEASAKSGLAPGLFALVLFVCDLFLIPFLSGNAQPIQKNADARRKLRLSSCLAATTLNAALLAVFAVFAPSLMLPASVAYAVLCGVLTTAISALFKDAAFIYSSAAFLIAVFVAFGGLFFDLSEISPSLGKASLLFPSSHYVSFMTSHN